MIVLCINVSIINIIYHGIIFTLQYYVCIKIDTFMDLMSSIALSKATSGNNHVDQQH